VAVLGAGGTMGKGMARNAAAADLAVHAWDRSADKLDDLAGEAGVEAFATAREAVADVDAVVTMLTDADATIAAMSGPDGGAAGSEGAVWVQMGTIGVEGSGSKLKVVARRRPAALARALRGSVRHGRGQRDLRSAVAGEHGGRLGRADAGRLRLRGEGQPLSHPHPSPLPYLARGYRPR
jgi:3-hydroxyisobutyrate dehydrogenase